MKASRINKWFEELRRIWLEKDIGALQNILAEEFKYYENPFDEPLSSWEEVEKAWQEINDQDIQNLKIVILLDCDSEGSAMYDFSYQDTNGQLQESKGSYFLRLDTEGKALEFRQWWTVKKF